MAESTWRTSPTLPRPIPNHYLIKTVYTKNLTSPLEGYSVSQLGVGKTSFANKTAWCWKARVPKPQVTGEIYDQILLDGIYLPYNWCLITATNGEKIIAWQWCQRENSAAYQALMNRLPAPTVVVTDGGVGIIKALRLTWPESHIQRCLLGLLRVWLTVFLLIFRPQGMRLVP